MTQSFAAKATTGQLVAGPTDTRRARDHRIDWLRGLALVSIFINHMPGNRFENWTTRNFGFSDAAEMFVMLAGVAAAFAYFPRFVRGDHACVALNALRRAAVLYGAHIASTLAAIAIFGCGAWLFADSDIYELIGIAPILAEPLAGLAGVLMGSLQLGYFNILPLYVVLLLLAPALLWLAAWDLRLMLGTSVAVYLMAHLLPIEMSNFPTDGGWFFNPFAWQLMYATGLALGILRLRGQTVRWHPVAGCAAALYVMFACVWMMGNMGGRVSFGLLPGWMDTLHKSMLPASRLLHVLSLTYLMVHSPLWPMLTRWSSNSVLTRLGRNSLPVFVLGSLLSMVGYITLVHTGASFAVDLALTVGGVVLMAAMANAIEAGMFQKLRVAIASQLRTFALAMVTALERHKTRTEV